MNNPYILIFIVCCCTENGIIMMINTDKPKLMLYPEECTFKTDEIPRLQLHLMDAIF